MKSSGYLNLVAAVFALVHLSTGLTFSTVDPPDTPSYVNFARTLADQFTLAADAPVDHFRTPGYPLFMRGVWAFLGERRSGVLAVQWLLLVSLALTVAHFVNTRLVKTPNTALYPAAVLLFLLDPLLTFAAYSELSELLFACLVFAGLFTWLDVVRQPTAGSAARSGLWLGLASITRPVSVFLPVLLAPLVFIRAASQQRAVAAALIFVGLSYALPAAWIARNQAIAGIPALATVGVFNLAHFRAAGVLAEAKGLTLAQADAAITARTGSVIETAADYQRTREVATEILSAHPSLVARQVVRGGLFQLLDPGFIYIAQIVGASPRGSGVLAALATQGPSALLGYFETMGALPSVLLLYSLVFTGVVYVGLLLGVWLATSRGSAGAAMDVETCRRWLVLVSLVSVYFVGIQAGPEASGRFRIPLLPMWHSVVLATLACLLERRWGFRFRA